jgi:hypothetical protein
MLQAEAPARSVGARRARSFELPRPTESAVLFWVTLALYLTVAVMLVLWHHAIVSDAWSRVASAHAVLHSRDPHLAALGFVWSPLPTFLLLPLVALEGLWPALVDSAMAASIVSALAMAGSVVVLSGFLRDLGLGRGWRLALLIGFAVHPITVHYAANGNSEALLFLTLVVAMRALASWMREGELSSLVTAGIALAFAYLTRYEAAAAVALAAVAVMLVSYRASSGTRRERRIVAAADVVVLGFPAAVAAIGWAFASWLITGSPAEQFTSDYGVSAQIATGFDAQQLGDAGLLWRQVVGLAPALPVLVGAALVFGLRGDRRWIAPIVVLGGPLLFVAAAWLTDRTAGWIRYVVLVVPLLVVLTAMLVSRAREASLGRSRPWRAALSVLAGAMVGTVLLSGAVGSIRTLGDPVVGRSDLYVAGAWQKAGRVADWLDGHDLPRGSVLMDSFIGYSVFARSDRPQQFVVTSDRDFQDALADPAAAGVRYVVVPDPQSGLSALDAVNRHYPTLYAGNSSLGEVVAEFPSDDHTPVWRIVEVTGQP